VTSQQPDHSPTDEAELPDTEVIAVSAPAPVFVDSTGRRGKMLRRLAYAFGVLVMLYGGLLSVSLAGGPVRSGAMLPLPGLDAERKSPTPAASPSPSPSPSRTASKSLYVANALPRRTTTRHATSSRVESTAVPPKPAAKPTPTKTPTPSPSTSHPVESTTTATPSASPSTPSTGGTSTSTVRPPVPPVGGTGSSAPNKGAGTAK
jgi:hypothetical protein